MYFLKYKNENIFLENNNIVIPINPLLYYYFIRDIVNISNIELNDLKLSNKNSLIIDLTSISAMLALLNNDNKIIEEYKKIKFENLNIENEDQNLIDNIVQKYLCNIKDNEENKIKEVDILKIIKTYVQVDISTPADLIEAINEIIFNGSMKFIIIFYKKRVIDLFKLNEIIEIRNNNVILFEINDKNTVIEENENIILLGNEITQISSNDILEYFTQILNCTDKMELNNMINYILYGKEGDYMIENKNKIMDIKNKIKKEFNIDNLEPLDYI